MERLLDLVLKSGMRPFDFFTDTAHLEQKLTRSDVTTLLLLFMRGDMTMSELAKELGAPLSSMTSIAKRLERKGYIGRKTSAADQRVTLVTLSPAGLSIAQEYRSIMTDMLARVEEALTPEELEQFLSLAMKIARVFQQHADARKTGRPPGDRPAARKISIED